ncbi:MAG TPA: hypothetical protein VKS81_06970 [Bacteroidota bacterium]|nr:hypothetical protein [Bacteroidota bacterium]
MEPIANIGTEPLYWFQPKLIKRQCELRAEDGRLFGTYSMSKTIYSPGVGETSEGTWTFKRRGFFKPTIDIIAGDTQTAAAVYTPKALSPGLVRFSDGREFAWKPLSFWRGEWQFADASDQPAIIFRRDKRKRKWRDILKPSAVIERGTVITSPAEFSILLLFGWHLLILMRSQQGAHAAVT